MSVKIKIEKKMRLSSNKKYQTTRSTYKKNPFCH